MGIFTEFADHFVVGIFIEPGDEKYAIFCPLLIDALVNVALIEDINAPFLWIQLSEEIFIVGAGRCEPDQLGHHIVPWKNCMHLESAFLFAGHRVSSRPFE